MKFDENLYVQIYAAAREIARKYGLDIHTAEDITQETAIEFLNILADEERTKKIRHPKNYIRGIIMRKFADHYNALRKKELGVAEIDYITDTINESLDKALDNQVESFSSIIDDYICRYPKSFTPQNKKLWEIFKKQQFSVPEMIAQMGTTRQGFDTAKNRLIKRIIAIYAKIATSHLI